MPMRKRITRMMHDSPLEVSVNMKLRYGPIVAELKRMKRTKPDLSVLEVGSGSKGITRFFRHPVTGVDVEFQEHKNKHLKEVIVKPDGKLPFPDRSFDAVISVDCIEHIPRPKRDRLMAEMKRVSKDSILITAPFEFTRWDRRVIERWPKDSPTYANIKEHQDAGVPAPEEIERTYEDCRIRLNYGEHPAVAYFIKWTEKTLPGKILSRTLLKPFFPLLSRIRGTARRFYFIRRAT